MRLCGLLYRVWDGMLVCHISSMWDFFNTLRVILRSFSSSMFRPGEEIHCCGNWHTCGKEADVLDFWSLRHINTCCPRLHPCLAEWILQKSLETIMTNDSLGVIRENDVFCKDPEHARAYLPIALHMGKLCGPQSFT